MMYVAYLQHTPVAQNHQRTTSPAVGECEERHCTNGIRKQLVADPVVVSQHSTNLIKPANFRYAVGMI